MRKINCLDKDKKQPVRIRFVKAPLVNTQILRQVLFDRTRALVL